MPGFVYSYLPAIARCSLRSSLLVVALLFAFSASGANLYVNDASTTGDVWTTSTGNNANPGTAALPLAALKFAIDNFVLSTGDTVFVDSGTYADEAIFIGIADAGVVVMGAGRGQTIFDQLIQTQHWMVVEGNNVHLHSMTITRYGFSTGLFGQALTYQNCTGGLINDIDFDNMGASGGEAAVYITTTAALSTEVNITNCVLHNTIGNFGGGIDVCANTINTSANTTVTITDCLIENNTKNNFNGGGLLVYNGLTAGGSTNPPTVTVNNTVIGAPGGGNTAMRGGGIYIDDGATVNLNSVCVSNNVAKDVAGPDGGGGIYILDGTLNYINGMVTENNANVGTAKYGGGIYINKTFSGTSVLNAIRVVVSGNTGLDGGGLYMDRAAVSLRNCLFYDNVSNDEGGAILLNDGNANLIMYNCTVTENLTLGNGSDHGGLENKNSNSCSIKNCIFWNNTNRDVSDDGGGSVDISFSIVDPSPAPVFNDQGNNLALDPLFLNASTDDFRLSNNTSPAFDAGTLDGGGAPTDDLVQMVRTGFPDIGAYELAAGSTLPMDCPITRLEILPVTLTSFGVYCEEGQQRVYWNTEEEIGIETYYLETDKGRFTIPAGNTEGSYSFELPFAQAGSTVKLYAEDFEYQNLLLSTLVLANCHDNDLKVISYPTYIQSDLQVKFEGAQGALTEIKIIDILGREHKHLRIRMPGRFHQLSIPASELPSGGFYVQVKGEDFVHTTFHTLLQ